MRPPARVTSMESPVFTCRLTAGPGRSASKARTPNSSWCDLLDAVRQALAGETTAFALVTLDGREYRLYGE